MNGLNPQSFFLALDLSLQSKLSFPCAVKEPLCLLLKKAVTFSVSLSDFTSTKSLLPGCFIPYSITFPQIKKKPKKPTLLLAGFCGLEDTIKIYDALLFDFKIRVFKSFCPSFYLAEYFCIFATFSNKSIFFKAFYFHAPQYRNHPFHPHINLYKIKMD